MRNRIAAIILTLSSMIIFITACSSGSPTTATSSSALTSSQGASLVLERCTTCHDISRVEGSRFSATQWKTVVDTMIARGAVLTLDEETVVVQWLAANYGN